MFIRFFFCDIIERERDKVMRKIAGFLVVIVGCLMLSGSFAAVKKVGSKATSGASIGGSGGGLTPKKASAVAAKESDFSTSSIGASLLPNAITLAQGAIQVAKQQKELAANCEPTSREINFVNSMIKEWAEAGAANPLGEDPENSDKNCGTFGGGTYTYSNYVEDNYDSMDSVADCYDVFDATEAKGAVWENFPKAAVATYCPSGESCSKNSKKASNMWVLFDMIDFTEKDYTVEEWKDAQALMEKATNCTPANLAAKKKEAFSGLAMGALGNLGQTTNTDTGSIMEVVSGVAGQKGLGGLGGIGSMATQFLSR